MTTVGVACRRVSSAGISTHFPVLGSTQWRDVEADLALERSRGSGSKHLVEKGVQDPLETLRVRGPIAGKSHAGAVFAFLPSGLSCGCTCHQALKYIPFYVLFSMKQQGYLCQHLLHKPDSAWSGGRALANLSSGPELCLPRE